jgi:uncharacterized membrane protein (DUF106 family)
VIEITSAGYEIALISMGVALLSSTIRHFTLDKERLREHKEKIKDHKEKANIARKANDMKAFQKHQNDLMEVMMENTKHGFKPMIFTMIPILLIFSFMRGAYDGVGSVNNLTIIAYANVDGDISSAEILPSGTYNASRKAIAWEIERVDAQTQGIMNATYALKDGGHNEGPLQMSMEYLTHNGTAYMRDFTSDTPPDAALLRLGKLNVSEGSGTVIYTLSYENTGSWMVADLFGWRLGWLGFYIVFSIIPSIIFNKLYGNS